jgi:Domain of unknown function (DUF4375)
MAPSLKKPDIDQLIISPNLNNSIIDLDNYICALCEWGDNIPALSYPQIAFYFNQEIEREVNNGGFDQYFKNSSGRYANDTIDTLKLVGANKTAKILESAIEIFPEQIVPIDDELRDKIYEQIKDMASELWGDLDQQFFKYEDNLNKLNMEFVKNNREYF